MRKKIFSFLLLSVVMLFIFSGCNVFDTSAKTVKHYLEAVLAMDQETASSYLTAKTVFNGFPQDESGKAMVGAVLESFSIEEITTKDTNEKEATVKVVLNGPDTKLLAETCSHEIFKTYFSNQSISEDDLNKAAVDILKNKLKDKNLKKENQTIDVVMVNNEGKWYITEESMTKINDILIGGIGAIQTSME